MTDLEVGDEIAVMATITVLGSGAHCVSLGSRGSDWTDTGPAGGLAVAERRIVRPTAAGVVRLLDVYRPLARDLQDHQRAAKTNSLRQQLWGRELQLQKVIRDLEELL